MRSFLYVKDIKAGMTVMVEDGLPCLEPGPATVRKHSTGYLYVDCAGGPKKKPRTHATTHRLAHANAKPTDIVLGFYLDDEVKT